MTFANSSDLQRVQFTINTIGAGQLTPKARQYLALIVSLVRMGYTGIACPIGAITRKVHEMTGRYKDSSTYAAFRELETAGFIRRNKYRVGADHFGTKITFNLPAFAYWTKQGNKKVSALPTITYSSPYLQKIDKDTFTISSHHSNSPITYIKRAKQCATNIKNGVRKWIPVINTIRVLCGSPRAPEVSQANAEISGQVENRSGIDWQYWAPRWPEMTIAARESTARRELLPRLRNEPIKTETHAKPPSSAPRAPAPLPMPEVTRSQIRALCANLESQFSSEPPSQRETAPPRATPGIPGALSADDIKILEAAKLRALARAL